MFSKNERFNRWSIRKVTVGVASVIVASGVFFLVGGADAHAAEVSENTSVVSTVAKDDASKVEVEKDADLKESTVDTQKEKVAEKKAEVAVETPSEEKETTVDVASDKKMEKEEVSEKTPVAEVQKAVVENTKSEVDVPASYLDKANFPGPFTAGVNQVIPYEFFGGDGMLTRLILNSSDKAPWSDNGVDKNAALLPVEKLGNGQYFYEVDLDGVAKGKSDKELLDILKAQGTQNYKAVIKVYAAKDGKADLSNVVATKELVVKLHKNDKIQQQNKQMMHEDSMMNKNDKMQQQNKQMMHENKMMNKKDDMMKQNQTMMAAKENVDRGMMMTENQTMMPKDNMMSTEMSNMMSENHKMQNKMMLPKTSSDNSSQTTGVLAGIFASLLAFFGLRRKANN